MVLIKKRPKFGICFPTVFELLPIKRKSMKLLQQRLSQYDLPQRVKAMGVYPYFRAIESDQDTEVIVNGKKVLMFGSNSYLGLTNHPEVKEASRKAIEVYGTGCAGSRFLNGTLDIHLQLEEMLARFVGKEEALVYSTGFQVNLGVVPALTGRNDTILLDDSDHASIIEGSRLAFSKVLKYAHNNMESLEHKLLHCDPEHVKLIVVDGIFSMEGDIVKLPDIVRLSKQYNASIMVDDAHALGVIGEHGSGTASHFGLTDEVDLIMGTFSKSLASIGGFIASDKDTINFLKHHSRPLIFSASITPASAASVVAALTIIKREPERIEKLWELTRKAHQAFKHLGFDTGHSETPIIPLYVRDDIKTMQMTQILLERGIFTNPVLSPAVKKEDTLIRFSLMATHTHEQLDYAIDTIAQVSRELGVIE